MLQSKKDIEEVLQKQRREAEENDAKRRAEEHGLPYLDLISAKAPTEIQAMILVPEAEAKKALLAALQIARKKLVVAVFDPNLKETEELLKKLQAAHEVSVNICSKTSLANAWSYYQYVVPEKEIAGKVDINEQTLNNLKEKIKSLENLNAEIAGFSSPYLSQILEIILSGAIALGASDIHLEPAEEHGVLRLRIDGLLHTAYDRFNPLMYKSIVTRIKLLSNLKLNISNEPQDGRFTIGLTDRNIEIRTSIIPSDYGETVVLRLLDPTSLKVNLEELGWRTDDLAIVDEEIKKPNGLILNTGPTGSGKTTTLYAFLRKVFKPEMKIITVEDPIEYHLPGISQTQVEPAAGYTFASGLRSILRQDPNVILVGEIRDKETADIAMNASLTGHLVFSTLHTNDAVGAIPRLIDLGVATNILGPSLSLVIAQRLVRVLCPACKAKIVPDDELKNKIQTFLKGLPARVNTSVYADYTIYESRGCDACGHIGYKGRTSIFELFAVDDVIEAAIYRNPTEMDLKKLAKENQMVTMQEDGVLKVLGGKTSFAEIERLTGTIGWGT